MAWEDSVIDGSISVASNKSRLNGNSAYIASTMAIDHIWNEGGDDGKHYQASFPDQGEYKATIANEPRVFANDIGSGDVILLARSGFDATSVTDQAAGVTAIHGLAAAQSNDSSPNL